MQLRLAYQHHSHRVRLFINLLSLTPEFKLENSLAYFPGLIYAFWLIYRKMRAEEEYGYGNWRCAPFPRSFRSSIR
jgi:hypothetical protein